MDNGLETTDSDEVENQADVTDDTPVQVHVHKYFGTKHVVNVRDSQNIAINLPEEKSAAKTTHQRTFCRSLFGKHIQFYNNHSEARRNDGFSRGLCFVNEELTKENPVCLKITETFYTRHGDCTMGFTTIDPSSLLATGILETRISEAVPGGYKDFFTFKPPLASCSYTGAEVFFWRNEDGNVVFKTTRGIEEHYNLRIDHKKPMWSFIELNGPLEAIEIISHEFHNVCGTGVSINEEIAEHSSSLSSQYINGSHGFICFTKVALGPGERFTFKVLRVCPAWAGNIRVGVTEKTPSLISSDSLPITAIDDPRFSMVELSLQHTTSNKNISVTLHKKYVAVFVDTTLSAIIPTKGSQPLWVVVDLFGNTTGVELVSQSPDTVPRELIEKGRFRDFTWSPSVQSIHNWWMDCEVLINSLKDMANAISAMTQWTGEGTWNYLLRCTNNAASYAADTFNAPSVAGIGDHLQMLEIGSGPERIRSNCPTLVANIKSFIEDTKKLKETLISELHPGESASSSEDTLTDLLRQFTQDIPVFDIQCPVRHPVPPSPSAFLLDLSMLPVEAGDVNLYINERVSKSLEKIAQKIEHALLKLEKCRFKMYTVLDG